MATVIEKFLNVYLKKFKLKNPHPAQVQPFYNIHDFIGYRKRRPNLMENSRVSLTFLYIFTVNGESDALIIWPKPTHIIFIDTVLRIRHHVRCSGDYRGTQDTVIIPKESQSCWEVVASPQQTAVYDYVH